jgi:hypothetical protein
MLTPIINRIIYQPGMTAASAHFTPAALSILFEGVQLVALDGVKITGWYMKAPNPRGSVLYLHGNAGNRRDWAPVAPPFISYTRWIMGFLNRPLHFVAAMQDISDEACRMHWQRAVV